MRAKGRIRSWNDDRGFGFIEPNSGGKELFLHISAFANRSRRPEAGQVVTYTVKTDKRGRPQAAKAALHGDRLAASGRSAKGMTSLVIASGFLVLVALAVIVGKAPLLALLAYLGLSLVTFFAYAADKSAAKKGRWRTPESTLHWLSLAGGWPGAIAAQTTLRHKSSKQSFRSVFWVTVVLNVCIFAWSLTPPGAARLQSWLGTGQAMLAPEQGATIKWAE